MKEVEKRLIKDEENELKNVNEKVDKGFKESKKNCKKVEKKL